jgi:hypothetical protein
MPPDYDPLIFVSAGSSFMTAALVLSCIGCALTLLVMALVYVHQRKQNVLAASPVFLAVSLIGVFLIFAALPFYFIDIGNAYTSFVPLSCHLFPFLFSTGFVCVFSGLLVKTWRIAAIFNQTIIKKLSITNTQLFIFCVLLIFVDGTFSISNLLCVPMIV